MRRGTCAVVVALFAVVVGCGKAATPADEPTVLGLPFSAEVNRAEPFAEAVFAEQAVLPQTQDPGGFVLPGDFDGEYTHVSNWSRRSYQGAAGGVKIWFFGGSTMFGVGQRDEHTIPSQIVRLAEQIGIDVEVENFGFPAYLARHEVGLLRRALDSRPPPDLIVVYHGSNDLGAVCRSLELGLPQDAEENPLLLPRPDEPVVDCLDDPESTGRLVADMVDQAMGEAKSLAPDVPVVEYWQPFAATRRSMPDDDALLRHLGITESARVRQAEPYDAAIGLTERPVVDLRRALDGDSSPVYFDWAHTNELGARLVADEMWRGSLRAEVEALAAARR